MRSVLFSFVLITASASAGDLKPGDGDVYVRAHCSACHSLALVTSQRGDRTFWLKTIRWMQKTQNLWPIPEEQEKLILDYLASHYDDDDRGRRPHLNAELLPGANAGQ